MWKYAYYLTTVRWYLIIKNNKLWNLKWIKKLNNWIKLIKFLETRAITINFIINFNIRIKSLRISINNLKKLTSLYMFLFYYRNIWIFYLIIDIILNLFFYL